MKCIRANCMPPLLLSFLALCAVSLAGNPGIRDERTAESLSNLIARSMPLESASRLAPRAALHAKRNMAPFERPKSPSEMLNPVSDKLKPALAKSKSTIHATATDKKTIV